MGMVRAYNLLACVASVPVRRKSSQMIFHNLAARKLGQESAPTFAWPGCGHFSVVALFSIAGKKMVFLTIAPAN